MTFTQFWGMQAHEIQTDERLREMAKAAWDTAVCAASACCLGGIGRLREPGEIHSAISRLHTWAAPQKTTTTP